MNSRVLKPWFDQYKEASLFSRYIHTEHIKPLLKKLIDIGIQIEELGKSEANLPIHLITLGKGSKKLLFWSQMHGNESTTTKAMFDYFNFLTDVNNEIANSILQECTLYFVPILNPDGAKAYTRLNHNAIDLNRDAQDKTQKESVLFNKLVHNVKPDIAFNLHGQRTIFSVGDTNVPATVSFLSPAGDEERSITESRKVGMEIIAEMNNMLQNYIPNGVGRYDDSFNINCVGDTLESMGIPTILFEAGHYPNDYDREETRSFIFYAMVVATNYISKNSILGNLYKNYFLIPENGKCFFDIVIRNVILNKKQVDIAIQYHEELSENTVIFNPRVAKIDKLDGFFGHKEIDGENRVISPENVTVEIVRDDNMLKLKLNSELFLIELVKS